LSDRAVDATINNNINALPNAAPFDLNPIFLPPFFLVTN
jgi:hypothetical protein